MSVRSKPKSVVAPPIAPGDLHARDFDAWIEAQAAALWERRTDDIDWQNAAEEIAGLGESQRQEIESRLERLLCHLLKWIVQPGERSNSWRATITEQRYRIGRRIAQSPSLRAYPATILAEEYRIARLNASGETGLDLDVFPKACPFAIHDILDEDFWPV